MRSLTATTLLYRTTISNTPHLQTLMLAVPPSEEMVGMVSRIFSGIPQKGQCTVSDAFMSVNLALRHKIIVITNSLYKIISICKGEHSRLSTFWQEGRMDRKDSDMILFLCFSKSEYDRIKIDKDMDKYTFSEPAWLRTDK